MSSAKPPKPPDPTTLYAEAQALKDQWIAKEREAIQAALVASDWFEAPAARLLGIDRSTLKRHLLPKGRHADLGEEAAKMRTESGYKAGNPSFGRK